MNFHSCAQLFNVSFDTFFALVKEKKVDINVQDPETKESLLWKAATGDAVVRLIKAGINLDIQDYKGNTWLHDRSYSLVVPALKALKECKVPFNPNIKRQGNIGILNGWGHTESIVLFLDYEYFSEPINKEELLNLQHLLHHEDVLKAIFKHKPNPFVVRTYDKYPIDYIVSNCPKNYDLFENYCEEYFRGLSSDETQGRPYCSKYIRKDGKIVSRCTYPYGPLSSENEKELEELRAKIKQLKQCIS